MQLFDRALHAQELPGIAGIPAGLLAQPAAESPLLEEAGVGSEPPVTLFGDEPPQERDGETTTSATKYYYLNGLRVAKATDGTYTWIHSDYLR